jgi:hypothetical protein
MPAVCAVPIMQLQAQNPTARPAFNLYLTAAEIALPPKKPSGSVKSDLLRVARSDRKN